MSYIKAIRKDIAQSEVGAALDKLYDLVEGLEDNRQVTYAIQLSARYNRLEAQMIEGLADFDEENSELAKIRSSILKMILDEDIPDKPYLKPSSYTTPPPLPNVVNEGNVGTQINSPTVNGDLNIGGNSTGGTSQTGGSERDMFNILMLTANPSDTVKLNLDREHSRITSELENSPNYSHYKLFRQRETSILDLNKAIVRNKPRIVHFSGHGQSSKAAAAVDESDPLAEIQPGQKGGLMLKQAEGDETQIVDAKTLQFMFRSLKSIHKIPLQLVMLNACHAEEQAKAIGQEIDYVIGTNDAIMDDAAWTFSLGFYFIIVNEPGDDLTDELVRQAFSMGQMNAMMQGEPADRFRLYIKGELQEED